jgi:putative transposase
MRKPHMLQETYIKILGLISGLTDKAAQEALLNMQKSLDYCVEENRVFREELREKYNVKRLKLSKSQKRRLAVKAIALNKHILAQIGTIFQPATILGWHRDLVARKYKCSEAGSSPKGRKTVSQEIIDQVLRLAKRNREWGYDRLEGIMLYLGLKVGRSTIKRILDAHGIIPDPELKRRIRWKEFLKSHWEVMAATDFLSVELLTPRGLVKCMIVFFIDIQTRKVELGGVKVNPDGEWMKQIARNQVDCIDGFLKDKKYLICDRDPLYTAGFEMILNSSKVKIKRTPPFSPNMNPHSEAFVKNMKRECLSRMIFFNEKQVRYAANKFIKHYNTSRPHGGIGGKMIEPLPQDEDGKIVEFESLGGHLRSYRRVKEPLDEAA